MANTKYTADELWDEGRTYALECICSDMDVPDHWTEEQAEEFYDTYEIMDVSEDEEEQTIDVEIEGNCGTRIHARYADGEWSIIEQSYKT